mmetsp:Transcript_47516/g.135623  ORF Transcript_47516/g.135623 Transcript_47516/m.135623 type:complete len:217 (+) Transcript_47516:45-695(+)
MRRGPRASCVILQCMCRPSHHWRRSRASFTTSSRLCPLCLCRARSRSKGWLLRHRLTSRPACGWLEFTSTRLLPWGQAEATSMDPSAHWPSSSSHGASARAWSCRAPRARPPAARRRPGAPVPSSSWPACWTRPTARSLPLGTLQRRQRTGSCPWLCPASPKPLPVPGCGQQQQACCRLFLVNLMSSFSAPPLRGWLQPLALGGAPLRRRGLPSLP